MEVVSLCALRAAGLEWRLASGAVVLTVVCKATFLLKPGRSVLAQVQERPAERDELWDGGAAQSVRVASDLAPYKPKADVVLVGHAYAPAQKPVRSFVARLVVGEVDKSIEVWCDRSIRWQDGRLLEGPRIVKRPLRWECAAGGPDSDNPVGMRMDGVVDRHGVLAVPSLQPVDSYVTGRGDTFAPIGFGPVAPHWPGRTRALHRYVGRFPADGWQHQPLPADFDYGYFNVAPRDQQTAALQPDQRIVLENMHPEHARLATNLPGVRPRAIADRATGEREEIALAADTLWIDTDRGLCTLAWRGRLGLRHAGERGRVAFWVDGEPVTATTSPSSTHEHAAGPEASSEGVSDTVALFAATPEALSETVAPPLAASDDVSQTLHLPLTAAKDPLPFTTAPDGAPPLAASPNSPWARPVVATDEEGTGTLFAGLLPVGHAADGPTLPFVRSGSGALVSREPSPPPAIAAPVPAPPPYPPGPVQQVPLSLAAGGAGETNAANAPKVEERIIADAAPPPIGDVAPPPMIGPLATPDMVAPTAAPPEPKQEEPAVPSAPASPPVPTEPELPLAEFPLERCARIAASLGRRKAETRRILEENGLTLQVWQALDRHWSTQIRDETRRGKSAKLKAYDAAYVAQLEKERGAIQPEEYAQITVQAERGNAAAALAELDLPRNAQTRIERVWLLKLSDDALLSEEVRGLMFNLRASE